MLSLQRAPSSSANEYVAEKEKAGAHDTGQVELNT